MYRSPFPYIFKIRILNVSFNASIQKLNCSDVKTADEQIKVAHQKILAKKLIGSRIFENTSNVMPLIQSNYVLKKNRHIFYSFVADVTVAEKVADKIISNMNNNIIIEGNAGFGLITHYLLRSNIKSIKIIEPRNKRNSLIDSIIFKNSDTVSIDKGNIFATDLKSRNLTINLIESGLGYGKSVTLIGVVPSHAFFTGLIKAVLDGGLLNKVETEFLLIISEYVLNNLTDFKKAKSKFNVHCLFNNIFSFEIIAEYPREAFLPLSDKNEKFMYLVKIVRNENSPIATLDQDHFNYYVTFLRILEKSRYSFVIKSLEKWIPDCGPHLIASGLGCANQVCDLTAQDSFNLFLILTKCDGFANFKTLQPIFECGRLYLQEPENQDLTGQANVEPMENPDENLKKF